MVSQELWIVKLADIVQRSVAEALSIGAMAPAMNGV